MGDQGRDRRLMRQESGDNLSFALQALAVLAMLAVIAALAFFLATNNSVLPEPSRHGAAIGEMFVGLVEATTGPLTF